MRLSNEGTLASAAWLSRQVCSGPFSPIEALVQHNAPMSKVFHEKWFGGPFIFDADPDAVLGVPPSGGLV